ncbi:hypothetical protein M8009_12895 [Halomonas sp. ATCH28]|uniref:Uncharacterized protein n=1 Tax=Halomonas gemina TaxID=2945105 RepID=A0ABT0T329_9GAMM|nr:hypothetical protein [Halomonas gemina]MCL7941183.1 hypothetical protein [Halomonas gemina]
MNSYTIGMSRPATRRDITERAEAAIEAVEERNPEALLAFAEHAIDEGLLGYGIEELSLGLTVEQLVRQYASTTDGKAEVRAWARQLAEAQCEDGIAA